MNATELIALGYRLIKKTDIGKVFGTDLYNKVYFDTSYGIPQAQPYVIIRHILYKKRSSGILQQLNHQIVGQDFIHNGLGTIYYSYDNPPNYWYVDFAIMENYEIGTVPEEEHYLIYVKDIPKEDYKKHLIIRNQSFIGRSNRDII